MKRFLYGLALAVSLSGALALGGCAFAGKVVQTTTTSTPAQVTTLGQAAQAMDIVVLAVDGYVHSGNINLTTAQRLQTLRAAVRKAMDDLDAANMRGESLVFAAFNTAYKAFLTYKSQQGI